MEFDLRVIGVSVLLEDNAFKSYRAPSTSTPWTGDGFVGWMDWIFNARTRREARTAPPALYIFLQSVGSWWALFARLCIAVWGGLEFTFSNREIGVGCNSWGCHQNWKQNGVKLFSAFQCHLLPGRYHARRKARAHLLLCLCVAVSMCVGISQRS